jgi:hypothetical protein
MITNGGYSNSDLYVMTPIYTALFYLTIALQYIKKTGRALGQNINNIYDKEIIERIKQTGFDRSSENNKITKSKYHEVNTAMLIKRIARIEKAFSLNKSPPPIRLYEDCKEILHKILSLYKKVFIDIEEFLPNEIAQYTNSIKSIMDIFSLELISVCGLSRLDIGIMNEYDILSNDISIIAQNVLRDLNA